MHPRPALGAVAVVVAVTLVAGCSGPEGGRYDGSCSAARSAVSAVDAATGARSWTRELAHPREDRPEVRGDALLLQGCGSLVLDADDGHRLLRTPDGSGVLGLVGGYLVSSEHDRVTAVPFHGGRGFTGGSTPPWTDVDLAGDLVLASGGGLTAMVPADGRDAWRVALPTRRLEVAARDDVLVVLGDEGSLYRLDARTGAVAWRVVPPAGTDLGYDRLLTVGRTSVAVSRHDVVAGLDLRTGQELWQRDDLPVDGSLSWAAVDDLVAVPTGTEVLGLDLRTGVQAWQLPADSSGPVAARHALVVDDALSYAGVDPTDGRVLWRRATTHHPLLGSDLRGEHVVVLDSPPVQHGMDDCC